MAGSLMVEAARRRGRSAPAGGQRAQRHSSVSARPVVRNEVRRLILTASGGPFRALDRAALERVTPEDALRHPDLADGPEDHDRLGHAHEQGPRGDRGPLAVRHVGAEIDVVIHPQSIVHSMVELRDGSVIAQLGVTDMRLPIQYAFSYPDRWDGMLASLDVAGSARSSSCRRTRSDFRACGSPTTRSSMAAPGRSCSTPRMKSPSTRFSPAASAFPRFRASSRRRWRRPIRDAACRVARRRARGRRVGPRFSIGNDRVRYHRPRTLSS